MKSIIIKMFLFIAILLSFNNLYVGAVDFDGAGKAITEIKKVSIEEKNNDIKGQIDETTKNIFKTIKIVIGGLLVIYLVYAGVMMILSMGSNEEKLTSSKRSIWYAILGLLFVNIPGKLYDSFSGNKNYDTAGGEGFTGGPGNSNIFINKGEFAGTLGDLIGFLQRGLIAFAIFMIVYSGIKIISAGGDEEKVKESKNKIVWSIFGLVFLGAMEVWKLVIFEGDFAVDGKDLFSTLANLALFFAGPTAIFFISLAGYYYITSAGDEEKVKKAKRMLLGTVMATLILLGIYTLLLDLKTLKFD